MSENKKFVSIQSSIDIAVTAGLQMLDVTNKDAHIPDRLKVQALWPRVTVMIYKGVGKYPAEITEWESVKKLVEAKILTIGQIDEEATEAEKEVANKLDIEMEDIKSQIAAMKKEKKKNLAEIAEE